MSRLAPRLALALLAAHLATSLPAAPPFTVAIVAPRPDAPLFGEVEVRIAVRPSTPLDRIEVYVDGVRSGVQTQPPWRLVVDVGERNAEHLLEVVAVARSGARASARLTSPAVAAQEEIDVALRPLFVRVERDGAPLRDLVRDDFTVYDEGARQHLVTFERGDVPFAAVVLLDASVSMREGRLEAAISGVEAFARAMQSNDEAKMLLFADRVLLETPFTHAPAFLTLGLSTAKPAGGTALNDALFLALARLEPTTGRKAVLVLSDGIDVDSVLSMADVRAVVQRSGVIVYWLRVGAGEPSSPDAFTPWRDAPTQRREKRLFADTVAESGGRTLEVAGARDVQPALAAVLQDLRDQYVLGYYPSVSRGTDVWHEVKVEVRAPGATVRTHKGYLEP